MLSIYQVCASRLSLNSGKTVKRTPELFIYEVCALNIVPLNSSEAVSLNFCRTSELKKVPFLNQKDFRSTVLKMR